MERRAFYGKLILLASCRVVLRHVMADQCLPDAVAAQNRAFIKDDQQKDIQIGMSMADWASSYVFSNLGKILVEEVLGYHAVLHPEIAIAAASQLWAVGGCLDINSVNEQTCDQAETRVHVVLDSWHTTVAELAQFRQAYPHLVPEDLGSMGFFGEESLYLTEPVLEQAYNSEGLALDFYKSYNRTHHAAKQFFDSVGSVNASLLQFCSDTAFHRSCPG